MKEKRISREMIKKFKQNVAITFPYNKSAKCLDKIATNFFRTTLMKRLVWKSSKVFIFKTVFHTTP